MTLDDVAELGLACLSDYKPRLKVLGVRKFDERYAATELKVPFECFLSRISPETLRPGIETFLDKMAALDEFTMSEPQPDVSMIGEFRNVSYQDLRLSFMYGQTHDTSLLWIVCWYYPSPV